MRVPPAIERKVVERLYDQASSVDWSLMRGRAKTEQYARWVEDPEIGGLLREYGSGAEARLWIKDGPMKAWNDAVNGVGRFAGYVAGAEAMPQRIVSEALGDGWIVEPASIRTKPTRLIAERGDERRVIAWSGRSDFKHIAWAALTASALGDEREWLLCVVETFTNPTPANERRVQLKIAARTGLTVKHIKV